MREDRLRERVYGAVSGPRHLSAMPVSRVLQHRLRRFNAALLAQVVVRPVTALADRQNAWAAAGTASGHGPGGVSGMIPQHQLVASRVKATIG
jgi:hypothetical protein